MNRGICVTLPSFLAARRLSRARHWLKSRFDYPATTPTSAKARYPASHPGRSWPSSSARLVFGDQGRGRCRRRTVLVRES